MAGWQNGYAEDCKSLDVGSIPVPASICLKILMINNFSELKRLGLAPTKKLGQNFLFDDNVIHKIVKIAALEGSATPPLVIEVGPGPGGLTRALLGSRIARLVAIEADTRMVDFLRSSIIDANDLSLENSRGNSNGPFILLNQDALQVNWLSLIKENLSSLPVGTEVFIVANLPYNIGTLLLQQWLPIIDQFNSLTIMLQLEVAQRLAAAPQNDAYGGRSYGRSCGRSYGRSYGRLSVVAQAVANITLPLIVKPGSFVPAPSVNSAVVRLVPKSILPEPQVYEKLWQLTKAAFQHRRKMCKANLRALHEDPEQWLRDHNLSSSVRAEEIPVETFLAMAKDMKKYKENI